MRKVKAVNEYEFGLGRLRFRWVGGRCDTCSILVGVHIDTCLYTTTVLIAVSTIFETGRPLLRQKASMPLYSFEPQLQLNLASVSMQGGQGGPRWHMRWHPGVQLQKCTFLCSGHRALAEARASESTSSPRAALRCSLQL
eukprot:SAG22_NODE_506_length_9643_cov_5.853206_5_plen_140_part_00